MLGKPLHLNEEIPKTLQEGRLLTKSDHNEVQHTFEENDVRQVPEESLSQESKPLSRRTLLNFKSSEDSKGDPNLPGEIYKESQPLHRRESVNSNSSKYPMMHRRSSLSILPLQKLEPNIEESSIGYENNSFDSISLTEANMTKSSQKLPTENHLFRDRSKQIANSRKNSITGSEKNENLWGRRKISVHNLMDFSLMIANIAQLKAVLSDENNPNRMFILICIIISMTFQIIFAVCMIRRQNLNNKINKAFDDVEKREEKFEPVKKSRRVKKFLDEIGNYLVLFILVANGLITGFGFM
jgi:hypothetical protein